MRELRELERGWGALGRGWVDEGEVGESFGCVESMAEMMLIGTVSWRVYGRRLSDDSLANVDSADVNTNFLSLYVLHQGPFSRSGSQDLWT